MPPLHEKSNELNTSQESPRVCCGRSATLGELSHISRRLTVERHKWVCIPVCMELGGVHRYTMLEERPDCFNGFSFANVLPSVGWSPESYCIIGAD